MRAPCAAAAASPETGNRGRIRGEVRAVPGHRERKRRQRDTGPDPEINADAKCGARRQGKRAMDIAGSKVPSALPMSTAMSSLMR
jgi:hypothetical protein